MCSSLPGPMQPAVFEGPSGYGSWVRAAISAPTVSIAVMIVPMPSSACWTGRRTTLMSWGQSTASFQAAVWDLSS
jgi:hypothetical protein